nr:hypothetical protein [Tanacetum cinerariifolium]
MLVTEQVSQGKGPTSLVRTQHTPTIIESSPHLQNISITYRKTKTRTGRIGIRIPQSNISSSAKDEAITKEMHDGLGRATTTASRLAAEQGSGNISKTQTKATPSRPSSSRTSSEGGLGYHFTIGDSPVQARPERLSNLPNELPLGEGKTSRSGEGSIQLLELMAICTKLSDKVTHLENELTSTKAVYNKAPITLTKRVKKLKKKLQHKRRRAVIDSLEEEATLDHEDSPKQGRMIEEINKDENVNLVKRSEQGEAHKTAEHRMDLSTASQTDDDETLAETLLNIKRSAAKDKGKAIMFVPMESKGQAREESSKEGESLKRSAEEELGHEQKVKEKIAQQEDVVAKQAKKESSKKAGGRLKRKTSKAREDKDKRQKKQDDLEKLTLMKYVEVISDSEEVIHVIPLAVKSPVVNWKSYCKGDIGYYKIHRADGSYQTYIFFSEMLNDFDREDLIVLYRLFNENTAKIEVSIANAILVLLKVIQEMAKYVSTAGVKLVLPVLT